MRRQGRDNAVEPRHADAHGDQREHVEAAGRERARAPLEERPPRPEDDGRGERQLDPGGGLPFKAHHHAREMPPHLQGDHGQGEDQPDPEASGHVLQLWAGARFGGHHLRLQRHSADRAGARPNLADLRMHRAGVDRADRGGRHRPRRAWRIARGFLLELRSAPGRTEEVLVTLVVRLVRGLSRIDVHSADWILYGRGRCARVRPFMAVTLMAMMVMMMGGRSVISAVRRDVLFGVFGHASSSHWRRSRPSSIATQLSGGALDWSSIFRRAYAGATPLLRRRRAAEVSLPLCGPSLHVPVVGRSRRHWTC